MPWALNRDNTVTLLDLSFQCEFLRDHLEYESMFATYDSRNRHMTQGIAITGSQAGIDHLCADNKRAIHEFQFRLGQGMLII